MIPTIKHIKDSTSVGAMAVWTDGLKNGYRLEAGRSLSGYATFKYYGFRLIVHHTGLTLKEAAACIDRWISERAD